MDPVIRTTSLSKHFGDVKAIDGLDLEVPRGSVFGYLGRNGSGKTTTIKVLLDLIKPTSGTATVLGYDPRKETVAMRQKIGYVAEGQKMYGWMKVRELIRFTGGFYRSWDDDLAEKYCERFELDPYAKVKTLSKGQNSRLSLLLALASRPELLILDDPTMGLDPISRQEFLGDIVRAIQEEGRTVFFSTHILQELEQVADWVGILDRGKLILTSPVDELKASVKRYELTMEGPAPTSVEMEGVLRLASSGRDLILTARGDPGVIVSHLKQAYNPLSIEAVSLSLDEIFAEIVLGSGEDQAAYVPLVEEKPLPGKTIDQEVES
jgi:ABC-2 type transport system ATP-binding protein